MQSFMEGDLAHLLQQFRAAVQQSLCHCKAVGTEQENHVAVIGFIDSSLEGSGSQNSARCTLGCRHKASGTIVKEVVISII